MIDDITFEDAILGYIEQKMSAPSAVLKAVDDFKAMFEEIDDEYLRERQKDIVDVGNRLLRKLLHMKEFSVVGADVILCAKDIEPSIMAGLSEKTGQSDPVRKRKQDLSYRDHPQRQKAL